MPFVEAAKAKKPIKKMLLGNGGSAQVITGNTTRMLSHSLAERPLTKLPWPLSLLQTHNIRYVVYDGRERVEEKTFTRRQINDAIRLLLTGMTPQDNVLLMPEMDKY